MKLPRYEVRAVCGDWALDIDKNVANEGLSYDTLYFHNRANADLVKAILEWEDAHPNKAVPYPITVTPPNEPLTLEQLREMDGEPVYIVFLPDATGEKLQFWALASVGAWGEVYLRNNLGGSSLYEEVIANIEAIYRRPPEGEEDT